MPAGDQGGVTAGTGAWLAGPEGRSCLLDALALHDLPAAWADEVAALLTVTVGTTGLDPAHPDPTVRAALVRTACGRMLEGASGRSVLLGLDAPAGADVPALAPAADDDDPLDAMRRRIPTITRGADWMAAAALAALAIRVTGAASGPDVPPPDAGPVPAAALWYAGRRDCFADDDGTGTQPTRALERRGRAADEVAAVLEAAGAPPETGT